MKRPINRYAFRNVGTCSAGAFAAAGIITLALIGCTSEDGSAASAPLAYSRNDARSRLEAPIGPKCTTEVAPGRPWPVWGTRP